VREIDMLEVLPKIAKMQASYALGKPLALPMNLTISVSYRCNSRCKTCNVWHKNFTLGVHTVISNFNVDEFETIYAFVRDELKPDSFISEIAEERVELDTVGTGITPPIEKYQPDCSQWRCVETKLAYLTGTRPMQRWRSKSDRSEEYYR
jgi:hypothetical protein